MLVETIFDYPGLGRLLIEAVASRDYPLMQALFLFITTGVLLANLFADFLLGVLDPRVRKEATSDERVHRTSPARTRPACERRVRPGCSRPKPSRRRRVPSGCASCGPTARAGSACVMLAVFVLAAVFAPLLAPHDPASTEFASGLPVSGAHWMGTTTQGQDVFSQLIYGARTSLLVGARRRRRSRRSSRC